MAVSGGGSPFDPEAILVRLRVITPEQLDVARSKGGDPMQNLLDAGLIDAYAVELAKAHAWANRQGYAFADLNFVQPAPLALACLPAEPARRHGVLPVKKDGNTLWVAFRDPKDKAARAWAKEASGCNVIAVLASPAKLEAALDRL